MPEYPGAVFVNHVGFRTAQVGSILACGIIAPLRWMQKGRKEKLFSVVMPRVGGSFFVGGYLFGAGAITVLAFAGTKMRNGVPLTVDGVDDRAYRITQNQNLQKQNDFVAAGMLASLVSGRSMAGKGLFGHMAVGATVGTLACVFAYGAMPEIRKKYWPQVKPQINSALGSAGLPKL
ncbi:hypothetical protein GUITHDRAFT_155701 [Guillardia theta CCMP2712]|uniref:Uncharacterized protein n=1 Tax=Guillardia theta (strain CCMP2712) TaxID=905079 RepID=L1IEE0_GUITC|nr:hypothetical protein GUITHDRAFT_155701 [Guillardia theta CCMP2712]EKX34598.1 hypothetical protein GUITHDRAFT_155701 [Guillardia theta CCMP2712]|eukprot:XP_005821578.1 hypothetical protein GUITHDRAFT_155701 [Guillardia theta CCMP2712]